MTTVTMPAGTYYIGDLCYVMHVEWNEVCELFFQDRSDHGCNEGKFTLNDGRSFVSFNTRYGDGTYRDQNGDAYYVDAGLIGCIRVDDIREDVPSSGRNIVTFDTEFLCSASRGLLKFGHIMIDTDPSYEVDDDDLFYQEDDE